MQTPVPFDCNSTVSLNLNLIFTLHPSAFTHRLHFSFHCLSFSFANLLYPCVFSIISRRFAHLGCPNRSRAICSPHTPDLYTNLTSLSNLLRVGCKSLAKQKWIEDAKPFYQSSTPKVLNRFTEMKNLIHSILLRNVSLAATVLLIQGLRRTLRIHSMTFGSRFTQGKVDFFTPFHWKKEGNGVMHVRYIEEEVKRTEWCGGVGRCKCKGVEHVIRVSAEPVSSETWLCIFSTPFHSAGNRGLSKSTVALGRTGGVRFSTPFHSAGNRGCPLREWNGVGS